MKPDHERISSTPERSLQAASTLARVKNNLYFHGFDQAGAEAA